MSKTWNFDQPLDDVKPTSSHEERAKIAALFHKQEEKPIEDVDYVAAFVQQQRSQNLKMYKRSHQPLNKVSRRK